MKQCLLFLPFLFATVTALATEPAHNFTISADPVWKVLDKESTKGPQFGGKWILIGTITLKQKHKEQLWIDNLQLQWHGSNLQKLVGSLYIKKPGKPFLAIQDTVICDGAWNAHKQALVLPFSHHMLLNSLQTFYVVLTVPENIEPTIKNGYFTIEHSCLPQEFQEFVVAHNPTLAFNTLNS